jgi:Flp pilus assembly protein TadD
MNQVAWVLATSPDASVRNGAEAVKMATRAVELSGGREPDTLDTLAAAYAESGRWEQATETARRALALAREPLAKDIRARLALYENRQPFRSNPTR